MLCIFFFKAEDGIRDLVRSRGLGDVYERQLRSIVRRQLRALRTTANQLHIVLLPVRLRKRQPRPHFGPRLHARIARIHGHLVFDVMLDGIHELSLIHI